MQQRCSLLSVSAQATSVLSEYFTFRQLCDADSTILVALVTLRKKKHSVPGTAAQERSRGNLSITPLAILLSHNSFDAVLNEFVEDNAAVMQVFKLNGFEISVPSYLPGKRIGKYCLRKDTFCSE